VTSVWGFDGKRQLDHTTRGAWIAKPG